MNPHPLFLKYWAHQLTLKSSNRSISGLMTALNDAKIDLLPYQLEAASKAQKAIRDHNGVILADEVGLGKTIEAGIIISERWLCSKRKILIIAPASLIEQWCMELSDKFQLPSENIDGRAFRSNTAINPFLSDKIILCSYHFARNKAKYISEIPWDLAVVDEAHNLCNRRGLISGTIRRTLNNIPKILLTATPLQNSVSELYSLATMINEYICGGKGCVSGRVATPESQEEFNEIGRRISPIVVRTLRKDSNTNFVNRIPVTKNFNLTASEKRLYTAIDDFLGRDNLHCFSTGYRMLMKMTLRRLLTSSPLNLAKTLEHLQQRLQNILLAQENQPRHGGAKSKKNLDDLERLNDFKLKLKHKFSKLELEEISSEIAELEELHKLASATKDSNRTKALLCALEEGLDEVVNKGGNRKAVIFTEFLQTQQHLFELIESKPKFKNRTVRINGSNLNEQADKIYKKWLKINRKTSRCRNNPGIDRKTALLDYFRDHAEILIATEAAAEGLNLQFCSLVINYDLPWNPQRIEQRIGRCHRYGQKLDVAVVNFMNLDNHAEKRLLELLTSKLNLFSGIFGLSNQVLGDNCDGKKFEKWVGQVFTKCRSTKEIDTEFKKQNVKLKKAQAELHKAAPQFIGQELWAGIRDTFKGQSYAVQNEIAHNRKKLWQIFKLSYEQAGEFNDTDMTFKLKPQIAGKSKAERRKAAKLHSGRKDSERLTLAHQAVQDALSECKKTVLGRLDDTMLQFDLSHVQSDFFDFRLLRGKEGWLKVAVVKCKCYFEYEELIYSGCFIADGTVCEIPPEAVKFLLECPCRETKTSCGQMLEGLDWVKKCDKEQIRKENAYVKKLYETYIANDKERLTISKHERLEALVSKLKTLQQMLTDFEKQGDDKSVALTRLRFDRTWKQYEYESAELEHVIEKTLAQAQLKFYPQTTPEQIFTVRWTAK